MRLSIIIPVYNEEKTILEVLDKTSNTRLGVNKEIIIVDDGSKDQSKEIIEKYLKKKKNSDKLRFIAIFKENGGKGSAVRKGIEIATGDIITIQDADLEYDPSEYAKLIKPILEGKNKVVYGSRFLKNHEPMYKIYYLGNKFLTFLTKVLYGAKITDMETCYKVFDKDVIKNIDLKANKFDMEPEITAKILRQGIEIKEMPITYKPRSIEEGKKINWKDGLQAIYTLFYWKIF